MTGENLLKKASTIRDFNDFIINYLLGDKYIMIVPDCEDDLWYQFIHHNCNNEKHKEE